MAHFATMIDMAKSPEEVKEEVGKMMPTVASKIADAPAVPVYPYGLCLSLEDDSIEKLALGDDLPEVGEMIHLCAMAKVTSVSKNERETTDGEKKLCRRIELQITHLATENEDEEDAEGQLAKSEARRKRFYGDGEKAA